MVSRKYNRTYHYPFSPGTTSDDRINHDYWGDVLKIQRIVNTEKLDGENTCLNGVGVFARSHAAPTTHPWSDYLKPKFSMMQEDLRKDDLEIFGENLYAVHSILYPRLTSHFHVFAVRCQDMWLSWEEVEWYANFFEFPLVPVLSDVRPSDISDEEVYRNLILSQITEPSVFGSLDVHTGLECTREGIVSRNIDEYPVDQFQHNVFKYVRRNHVKTDEHWTKSWKRAPLLHELPQNQ